jgi:hypothetical protein
MTEDPIPRGVPEITQDIGGVEMKVARQRTLLINGESAEQIGDVPGRLTEAAHELLRLAAELADVWPKPKPVV